jgi:hypothetical protein
MLHSPAHHRRPRAGADPITDQATAFAAVSLAVSRPLRFETIVLVLDDARCGVGVVVVAGTARADDVVGAVECLADPLAHGGEVAALVLASVRPGERVDDPADLDRWLELSQLVDDAGLELLEWFVITGDVRCPRDVLGERPRW